MDRVRRIRTLFAPALLASLLAACSGTTASTSTEAPVPQQPAGAEAQATAAGGPPPVAREFRGAWIAAVANIDWPSVPGLTPDSQRAELIAMFDRARELGLNAVVLHVRPAADALYASELEPWSAYLTGAQGRAPEPFYDPLEFAVREAHARGLELHAWFNPYRAWHPANPGPLAATHISQTNPELVRRYGTYLWMDPGEDAVRQRSIDVVVDVVRRYDVDGVHIDDYFYPYRERGPDGNILDFPDSTTYARYLADGGTLERGDWRRNNVDRYVAEMYDAVKREKPWVKVGISPIGTWRPNVHSQIGGFDAYEQIYADARKWFLDGTLDYMVPQLYWPIARTDVSFPVLLDWWANQNPHGRGLYAGLIPGNVSIGADGRSGWHGDEIIGQIYITRGHPGSDGHVHFRMGSLMPGSAFTPIRDADTIPAARRDAMFARQTAIQARRDSMTTKMMNETYAYPALTPAMTWLDEEPPAPPSAARNGRNISIRPGTGEVVRHFVVQARWPDGNWTTEILPARTSTWTIGSRYEVTGQPLEVWISAVDRVGNQSDAVAVN